MGSPTLDACGVPADRSARVCRSASSLPTRAHGQQPPLQLESQKPLKEAGKNSPMLHTQLLWEEVAAAKKGGAEDHAFSPGLHCPGPATGDTRVPSGGRSVGCRSPKATCPHVGTSPSYFP